MSDVGPQGERVVVGSSDDAGVETHAAALGWVTMVE
jgi:hypothetical protein